MSRQATIAALPDADAPHGMASPLRVLHVSGHSDHGGGPIKEIRRQAAKVAETRHRYTRMAARLSRIYHRAADQQPNSTGPIVDETGDWAPSRSALVINASS